MLVEQQHKKELLIVRQEPKFVAPSVPVAMDAEVFASAPVGIVSTTDTSKEFDSHKIKAEISCRLKINRQEAMLSVWYTYYVLRKIESVATTELKVESRVPLKRLTSHRLHVCCEACTSLEGFLHLTIHVFVEAQD